MTYEAVHLDFETRSAVDLNKCGVEVYAAHPSTEMLCMSWAFDDGPVHSWSIEQTNATRSDRLALRDHIESGGLIYAHNARFELHIMRMLAGRIGWPMPRIEQMRCTMAAARALSLPGSLDKLAQALRLPVRKDDAGRRIMLKMCKPRKPRKHEPDALYWHETPEDLAALSAYCAQDVEVERQIEKVMRLLPPAEQSLWEIDQRINDRGVCLDLPAVDNLLALSDREKARLTREIRTVTRGAVTSPNSKSFAAWFNECGFPLENMKKGTIEAALKKLPAEPVTPEGRNLRRALEIRKEAAKASTAKLKAMRRGAGADNRARGLLEYHGAGTGRWAGRRIQTQNMPRTPDDFEVIDAEAVFEWAQFEGGERGIAAEYGSALDGVSWSLRSLITAGPGNTLLCADYSNIEGRVLAWLAGERWKIEAFEAFDTLLLDESGAPVLDKKGEPKRKGPDLYLLAYSKSFGVPVEQVSKPQRQIGKVQELALGYQGGHGAFLSMGANYGIDLDAIAAAVREAVDGQTWHGALERYWEGVHDKADEIIADVRAKLALAEFEDVDDDEFEAFEMGVEEYAAQLARRRGFDLSPERWAAIRIIVDGWRAAHPNVVQFWRDLERAAVDAVMYPGEVFRAGMIQYRLDGDFLYCRLPSGRALSYPYARIVQLPDPWAPDKPRPRVRFEGIDGRTKRWCTQALYGGLCAENVTQAASRDILADAIRRLERSGYPVVMHVHDEIVSEVPQNAADRYPEFERIMAAKEPWASGLPVAVAGYEGRRYRK